MKIKIRLDTLTDVKNFVNISNSVEGKVIITDDCGMRVNGKSLMGVIYALEFNDLWCETSEYNYHKFSQFIIV